VLQRFLIDSQIKFWELKREMYFSIAISRAVVFKVDVFIEFADTFRFTPKAEANSVTDFNDLSKESFTWRRRSLEILLILCATVSSVL
jgi:hypothetical protein